MKAVVRRFMAVTSGAVMLWVGTAVTAPTAAGQVLSDDFDDNTTNTSLWTAVVKGYGPAIAEVNQRLEITHPADSAEDPATGAFSAAYVSPCLLRGDFDIQVDYELIVWPPANGVRIGLGTGPRGPDGTGPVERASWGSSRDFPGWPREVYVTHFVDGVQAITATNDMWGKLRLVRSGGTITGYYFGAGGWVTINTGPATIADVHFEIASWSHDYAFTNHDVKVAFDNFAVSSGEVFCPARAGLDHFKCYRAKEIGRRQFEEIEGIRLDDQFGPAAVDVMKPRFLCAPADKEGSGINDPSAHLCCYVIKGGRPETPKPEVEIQDQFGTLQLELVGKPELLCQPCSKSDL